MNRIDKLEIFRTFVELLILIVMTYTVYETYLIRKADEYSSINSTIPIIILDIKTSGSSLTVPMIKNIGYGPAFNIEISDLHNREFKAVFRMTTGLEENGVIDCNYSIYDTSLNHKTNLKHDSLTTLFDSFLNYKGERFMGRSGGQSLGNITITYSDVKGKKHSLTQSINYSWIYDRFFSKILSFPE